MAQTTHGIRAILSNPLVYSTLQTLMGAKSSRESFVKNYVRPFPGIKVLDIACGPADILAYFTAVKYSGFDISEDYIDLVRKRALGQFHCRHLALDDLENLPLFDVVFALGLIHHLGDGEAINVMQLALRALKPGGRLLTIDPCLDPCQSSIARRLIRGDRGQNVRNKAGYEKLRGAVFESPRIEVKYRAWIPYAHYFMECS